MERVSNIIPYFQAELLGITQEREAISWAYIVIQHLLGYNRSDCIIHADKEITIAISDDNVQQEERQINSILIEKNTKIPCAVTKPFLTTHKNQTRLRCTVTESITPETDPKFVDVLWEGELNLPEGRPAHQEIKISFSYDVNQIVHCEFTDIETGAKTEVDIQMGNDNNKSPTDKFLIE